MSFSPEVERDARPGVLVFVDFEASSSRYADPEAEGVTPVFRTIFSQYQVGILGRLHIHIFLRTFGALDLAGLSICVEASLVIYFEYTGAEVPPEGPLILLLSVILREVACEF